MKRHAERGEQIAGRIEQAARRMGYSILQRSSATTGSEYLYLQRSGIYVTVRISDHDICYLPDKPTRLISLSPGGYSFQQALDLLQNPENIEEICLDPEIRRQWAEAERHEREQRQAVLKQTPAAVIEYYQSRKDNRNLRARIIAQELGLNAGDVYKALNHGKSLSGPKKNMDSPFAQRERQKIAAMCGKGEEKLNWR
jgi:hypothetical protein